MIPLIVTVEWFGNVACSMDLKVGYRGEQTKLSDEKDWTIVHQLRQKSLAIVVGSETVLVDNPSLKVKSKYIKNKPNHPIRIIFDRRGRLNREFKIFNDPKNKPWWITKSDKELPAIKLMYDNLYSTIKRIEKRLEKSDLEGSIMVEGGPTLLTSLINEHILDHIRIFRVPKILSGGLPLFDEPLQVNLYIKSVRKLGSGIEEIYGIE